MTAHDDADRVSVRCATWAGGFRCSVSVGHDADMTRHDVTLSTADLARLAPGHDGPEALVRASFGFLLEREPREAILRSFDITDIERYFPGYPADIRARLAAT